METLAAFVTIASGSAATVGPPTAAMAALPSLTTVATTASLLSGGFSAVSGIMQGNAAAAQFEQQRMQSSLSARQEAIRGMQESNAIRERLLQTMANNNAAAGASGIDIGSGSVQTVQNEVKLEANRQLSIARANSRLAELSDMQSALYAGADAGSARRSGLIRAGGGLLQTASSALARGA